MMLIVSFPLKVKYISDKRLQKPWLSSGILKSIKTKANYFKLYKAGLIGSDVNKRYKDMLTTVIRKAKLLHYQNAFSNNQNDIRKTWKLLRGLMGKGVDKKRVISALNIDGNEVTDEKRISENFSEYFSSIASSLDNNIRPCNVDPMQYLNVNLLHSFWLYPTSVVECERIIGKLKNTKYNTNTIPVKLFKRVSPILCEYIVKLINNSFSTGIFPACLKQAIITPIYKSGDKQCMSNYRPISVLPLMSKIFERCVASRLVQYINKHSLISASQFGFREGKSTFDEIENLTEFIYSSLNEKKSYYIGAFIDFSKAFDTVNHAILLDKLTVYGVKGLPYS